VSTGASQQFLQHSFHFVFSDHAKSLRWNIVWQTRSVMWSMIFFFALKIMLGSFQTFFTFIMTTLNTTRVVQHCCNKRHSSAEFNQGHQLTHTLKICEFVSCFEASSVPRNASRDINRTTVHRINNFIRRLPEINTLGWCNMFLHAFRITVCCLNHVICFVCLQ